MRAPVVPVIVALSAIALGFSTAPASAQSALLLGTWKCQGETKDETVSMTLDYERSFDADGKFSLAGTMHVVIAQLGFDARFLVNAAGSYRFEAMALLETLSNVEVKIDKEMPSQLELMLTQQLQQQFANSKPDQKTQLDSLTETKLEFNDGGPQVCEKVTA